MGKKLIPKKGASAKVYPVFSALEIHGLKRQVFFKKKEREHLEKQQKTKKLRN